MLIPFGRAALCPSHIQQHRTASLVQVRAFTEEL